jgi:hypothetical protein
VSQADAAPADWYEDPSKRFEYRYWDGTTWTGHVATGGKTDWDPPADEGDADAEHAAGSAAEAAVAAQPEPSEQPEPTATGDDSAFAPPTEGGAEQEGPAPMTSAGDGAVEGGTIEEGEPSDTNLVANQRAGLEEDVRAWVDEVAGQVEPRLSRITPEWTGQPQAEAARACAYGLLVGHLAHLHPHMRAELSQVAEAHPSFTTLEAGQRLDTLEQIAGDARRTAAWLGPLIGVEDEQRVQLLFD